MFWKLLLLFVAVPLIELFLLLVVSYYLLGPLSTIALVLGTGIAGAWLARWQGTQALRRIRKDLAAGKMPTDSGVDAVLIFLAGAFLMTPGILTDLTGFALLVPAGRRLVKHYLTRWFKSHFKIETNFAAGAADVDGDRVIDSYAVHDKADDADESSA